MKTSRTVRYAAAALGMCALALLGVASTADAPAATTAVVARAHPGAGPTFTPPKVPVMRLGETEGEPPPAQPPPGSVTRS